MQREIREPVGQPGGVAASGMERRRLLLAGTAALALVGCGGGGGVGTGGATPVPGGSGGPSDPGEGGDPSQFTAQERIAATERVAEQLELLTGGAVATPQDWATLRDWLLTQPEYTDAGVGDELVWARFRDGRHFVYSANWHELPPDAVKQGLDAAMSLREEKAAVAGTGEVPGSYVATILSFTGPEFEQEGTASLARMGKALEERGWVVAEGRALTVERLMSLGEPGFLFMTSHSGLFGPGEDKEFSVMTDTVVTVGNELALIAELATGRLIYHRDRTLWQRLGRGSSPRYAITTAFVRRYFKFASNSLVIMLSCNSGAPEAAKFQQAMAAQGASTLIGWSGNSNGYAFQMVDTLIDRLTGFNGYQPPAPRARAFDMDDVWSYLSAKGLLVTPPAEPGGKASHVMRFGDGFNLSNPVITELQVKADDRLVIHGSFGSEPGTVTIGGTAVAVSQWRSDAVELVLPTAPNDPPGSLGDVVVKVRGRTSNPRTLASWRGLVSYRLDFVDDDGVLSQEIKIRLHLRADAYARRTAVDGGLLANTWNVLPASDTTITYEGSGTRDRGDGDVEIWRGIGVYQLANGPFSAQEPKMALYVRVDALQQRFELTAITPVVAPALVRTRPDLPPTLPTGLMFMPPFEMQFMNENGTLNDHEPLVYGNYVPFGTNGSVAAGQHVAVLDELRRTVKWEAMTALPALTDQIGR
ncbi:MAG: hypothetical protein KF871_03460 [Hydrogenophaga sp.]|uniref:hypothetical protein n=1 Tax=Hydrogenophaga sp. TaxID=1904254 RepID=UPI001D90C7D3|nr:hypothetical protein [Hydrogenophaga sp.]MBX3608929.1 hypothetical protein [Hydrogenophaga sp.]